MCIYFFIPIFGGNGGNKSKNLNKINNLPCPTCRFLAGTLQEQMGTNCVFCQRKY